MSEAAPVIKGQPVGLSPIEGNGEVAVSNLESDIRNRVLDTSDLATKALLVCGAVAALLFTVAWLGEGAARANYDPLQHPISSLSIGGDGWMQVASFIITGLLILAFSIGLRRALRPSGSVWGPLLVGLVGVGLIGAGTFVTDPLNGYPPGTPRIPTERTTHGILHDLFGIPFFLGLPITCFVFARLFARLGERRWAAYSACSGFAMFAVFFLARLGMRQVSAFADIAGLFGLLQRITVIIGFSWIALLAVHLLKASGSGAPLLIGAVAIGTVSSVLYAPCLTEGCAMIHTVVSTEISAPPELVAALYADYEGWPRLFPATIRGVRLLADDGQRKTIEVDHASEGKVINIMMVVSPHEIRLEEFKRRFDARFINRFEAAGQATRYSIVADVQLKGVARALAPLAPPIVRVRLNRFVLEPMRAAVESGLRTQQAATPKHRQ